MSKERHPLNQYLDFREASIGEPEIEPTRISVPIRGLGIWRGFPDHQDRYFTFYESATLVFEGVISSKREIVHPAPFPQEASREVLEIGSFQATDQDTFLFNLYGESDAGDATVDWDIEATSVTLQNARLGQAQFTREHPLLELLEYYSAMFGTPEIGPTWIRLPVRDIWVYAGFPEHPQSVLYETCTLVIEDVVSAVRTVSDNSTGFWEKETITYGPFREHNREVLLFEIEGHSYDHPNPYASVYFHFEIMASSIRIEQGKEKQLG